MRREEKVEKIISDSIKNKESVKWATEMSGVFGLSLREIAEITIDVQEMFNDNFIDTLIEIKKKYKGNKLFAAVAQLLYMKGYYMGYAEGYSDIKGDIIHEVRRLVSSYMSGGN